MVPGAVSALHQLAETAGVARCWQDAEGRAQTVADDALRAILEALGHRTDTERSITESLALIKAEALEVPAFLSAEAGAAIALPPSLAAAVRAEAVGEDGAAIPLTVDNGALSPLRQAGYYRLNIEGERLTLAVAPPRCVTLTAHRRLWGAAVQIPALRGETPTSYGDFGDVAQAARALAGAGADALAISPVHALYPGDGSRFSPYSPSSRRFLNGALASPVLLGLPGPPFGEDGPLIDWERAIPERLAYLRTLFDGLTPELRARVRHWADEQGTALTTHALFDSLYLHFGRAWPTGYDHSDSDATRAFARTYAKEVDFHIFVQWLADQSLDAAQREAKAAGMAVGLIADLAVGVDPAGSDAWAMPGLMLSGLSIGAPPDPLGPDGQNWGLTSFSPACLKRSAFQPFIETLRTALRHAGALRIDHGFGLKRLWVVPQGGSAADGAYVSFPFDDLLRVIAIESHRASAAIIAEDLGTMPPGFRDAMSARGIYGMRVLWFERDEAGAFRSAAEVPEDSVAMTGTHDTPTVAGWWTGRDIEWNRALGRSGTDEARRDEEREALWRAVGDGNSPPAPNDPAPVVDAALAHVASSPASLAIVPLEDLAALEEQPNMPGTVDEHPNWRRRMPAPVDQMLNDPAITHRTSLIDRKRSQ
ncbi:4-alpha-glucanotransferase [Sphingomonas paucimobilis]|nr:4-alpha-glucanotransferase [Sphingomonas paucimobilis]